MTGNWFKVSREIFSHEVAGDQPWCEGFAWLYLVSKATHEDYSFQKRAHSYPLRRGQLALSMADFGKKAGWNKSKVRRFLVWLHKKGMIQSYSDGFSGSFIKIVNYDKWQGTVDDTVDDTVDSTVALASQQGKVANGDTVDDTVDSTVDDTGNKEGSSHTLFKKRVARTVLQEKEPPNRVPKPKAFTIPHLTFNRETLTVDGFDDKARAYAATLFPNKDLDKAFHTLVEWIVKTDKRYLNFWKAYITICAGMPDEVVTRFNSGALKGQAYRIDHSGGQVQANKRPEPVMDISKFTRKD
jgi:hypothetical protein